MALTDEQKHKLMGVLHELEYPHNNEIVEAMSLVHELIYTTSVAAFGGRHPYPSDPRFNKFGFITRAPSLVNIEMLRLLTDIMFHNGCQPGCDWNNCDAVQAQAFSECLDQMNHVLTTHKDELRSFAESLLSEAFDEAVMSISVDEAIEKILEEES